LRTRINWFGLAGSVCTLTLIAASVFVPWWQLTVGEDLIQANWSPLNTNLNFAGDTFTVPLVWALNIASIILLLAGGIALLIYSLYPKKPYSKKLLGFGYRKPLYSLILFLFGLVFIIMIPKMAFGIDIPLIGSIRADVPQTFTQEISVSVLINASFQWTFVLAIAAVALCLAARLYHNKVVPPQSSTLPNTGTTPNSPSPSSSPSASPASATAPSQSSPTETTK